jgi:hypothetical protein
MLLAYGFRSLSDEGLPAKKELGSTFPEGCQTPVRAGTTHTLGKLFYAMSKLVGIDAPSD